MQEPQERSSPWIRLAQAGTGTEILVLVLSTLLGLILSALLGFNNLISLIILSFGLTKVFWNTVRKLAREDARELGLDPNGF